MKNNNIWVTLNNKLTKIFSFENQTQLAEFLLKIAKHADQIGSPSRCHYFQMQRDENRINYT